MPTDQMRNVHFAEWSGYCPICQDVATFTASNDWFRDSLLCSSCVGGSLPRERAMMVAIERVLPTWRSLQVHESSPSNRGLSARLQTECGGYVPSQLLDAVPLGSIADGGVRCENLERQTFADESFDLVVTQDVMEHVFRPDLAYQEIARTLRPGGYHIHTTPIYKGLTTSARRATLDYGVVTHLADPEYHGNPVGDGRSLVTYHYGYDLPQLISEWAPSFVSNEVIRFHDYSHGLVAEFLEVIICRKARSGEEVPAHLTRGKN